MKNKIETVVVATTTNEKTVATVATSNNKTVKWVLNQSAGCVDRQRNKLRNDLTKIMIEKTYMVKGQKFGSVELENKQQVSGLIRTLKPMIETYVNENTTEYDLNELWGLQNETTQKSIGSKSNITKTTVTDQHIKYFTNTLTKKVKN